MNIMNDNELIEQIAQIWVDGGGDYDGFLYCFQKILKKIDEIREERNET